jgi:hypothetical protein
MFVIDHIERSSENAVLAWNTKRIGPVRFARTMPAFTRSTMRIRSCSAIHATIRDQELASGDAGPKMRFGETFPT